MFQFVKLHKKMKISINKITKIFLLIIIIIINKINGNKNNKECEIKINKNKKIKEENLIDRIIFIHTRKCGGWTIHNYFSSKLKSQIGNSCNNISMKESNDWRCDMKYIQDTKEEEQCKAFKKFYNSRFKLF